MNGYEDRLSSGERAALLSGIGFGVLQVVGMIGFALFVLPALGDPFGPVSEKAAAMAANADRIRWGNYLLMLPTPLFLLFLGGLYTVLARFGEERVFAGAAVVAGAATAMLWPLAAVVSNIGLDIAVRGGDPVTIVALDAIAPYTLALGALGRVVLLTAAAAVVLRSAIAPRWIGWLAIGVASVQLLGSATLVVAHLFPLLALGSLLFDLWLIAFCVALLRTRAVERGGAAGTSVRRVVGISPA